MAVGPLAGLRSRLVAQSRELASEGASDRSVYALLAANLIAGAAAVAFLMDLNDLMLVYWVQSVVIGISSFIRMLSLQDFSTDGLSSGGKQVPNTPRGKTTTAFFFLFHYGCFHAFYFVFIVFGQASWDSTPIPLAGLVLCAITFALSHGFSLAHNIRADRSGRPNLGTLMMLPYARIIPMHITILAGGAFTQSLLVLLLFIGLKTGADVIMHIVEHRVLRRRASPPV